MGGGVREARVVIGGCWCHAVPRRIGDCVVVSIFKRPGQANGSVMGGEGVREQLTV